MNKPKNTRTYQFNTTSKKPNQRSCDCVVRAISLALGKTWEEVYKSLCEIGMRLYRMPNEVEVYSRYLKEQGWEKQKMPKKEDGKRWMVGEYCKQTEETIIVHTCHHLTCLRDGKIHDIWDCSGSAVGVTYKRA